jgi:hypothetical protein
VVASTGRALLGVLPGRLEGKADAVAACGAGVAHAAGGVLGGVDAVSRAYATMFDR